MSLVQDLAGTSVAKFFVGIGGTILKSVTGGFAVRNTTDTADASLTASTIKVSNDNLVLNSDGANTGTDYTYLVSRPTDASAIATLELPFPGSPGQVLAWHASVPGKLISVSAGGSTADKISVDTTTISFGSTTTTPAFTLPASAVVEEVCVILDTTFNSAASLSVGISGSLSKYVAASQVDLTYGARTIFEIRPGLPASGSSESLLITFNANGATAGSCRVEVYYAVPS